MYAISSIRKTENILKELKSMIVEYIYIKKVVYPARVNFVFFYGLSSSPPISTNIAFYEFDLSFLKKWRCLKSTQVFKTHKRLFLII